MSRHRRGPSMADRRQSIAQGLASRNSRQQLVRKGVVVDLSSDERRIRELDAEVAALKGELEQQASNHSRDLVENMGKAERVAQEANLEFASQARGIHVMREKHLKEKKEVERNMSRTLLDQIKKRKGKFYDDVSAALKSTMEDEAVQRLRELEQELKNLENQLQSAKGQHRHELEQAKEAAMHKHQLELQAAESAFDARLDARLAQLTTKHEEDTRRKNNETSKQHSDDLDKIQREWAARWSDRERDFLETEAKRNQSRQDELDAAKTNYKNQKIEMEKRHHVELKERDRRDMALLQEKLNELGKAREALDRDRLQYEKDSAEKYSRALESAKEQDRQSRSEMDGLRQREVEALEASIREERKMYIDSREQMERAHVREITSLRALVEDERKRSREKATRFEDELERKFNLLSEGLGESFKRMERACIADMESTVVDISIPPPSFKPVSLLLPRSSLF